MRGRKTEVETGRGRNSQVEPFIILQVTIYSGEFYLLEEQVAKTGSYSRGRTDSTFDRRSVEKFGGICRHALMPPHVSSPFHES